MTKPIRLHGMVGLCIGVPSGAFAAALMKHGAFGMTPFYSVSLSLRQTFGLLSMGTWNSVFQVCLILALCVILRKAKPMYIFSFLVAAAAGVILDGFNILCALLPETLPVRIACFGVGFVFMSVAISFCAECKMPVAPMNLFVRELAEYLGKPFHSIKLYFDIGCLLLSVTVSLVFARQLFGIGVGTLIGAFFQGPLSGVFIRAIRRNLEFYK